MENKISWQVLEYKRKEKTTDWYWAVIIITLSIVIISFFLHDTLFALLIIVATVSLLLFSFKEPKIISINIDRRGITVEKEMYPFATLEAFWVDILDEDEPKMILRSKKKVLPLIIFPIEEQHHLDVRDFLLKYLPEVEMYEPVSHKIMEKLGF
jgi:hypothetical protein